jgi:2-polyprenyl-3-methyl-5-hydroxy-6-metoxy-1,4-benzoquinol methylase
VSNDIHTPLQDGRVDLASIWSERTQKYGARCVINLSYRPDDFAAVTERQREIILPLLAGQLSGREERALDFGCGPGRFSANIATAINGDVLAVDVCDELIALCPKDPNVTFIAQSNQQFFTQTSQRFDVIWICLVLGGIPDPDLAIIGRELTNLLTERGLLFMIEHISETKTGNAFWKFRTFEEYAAFFPEVALRQIGSYDDFGEEVAILSGRRGIT